ncbi:MAG TPA: hypothetical protein VMF64_15235 [Steroidobacteraceae bacterium]|nr:hypothetical protein [Steroidobacteraceae bacterium]
MNIREQGPAAAMVDPQRPWLGLASFTEEARAYFFGREAEITELTRRVQRKLLTVLFGKSGLGKTSILRAGLVPRLRAQNYFPVYLRIDYGHDSPEPAEQIRRAINLAARDVEGRAADGAGVPPVADSDESIWEWLHRRGGGLRDAAGQGLFPLLIFDQFEELFTLAQSDEFGRSRATRFVEELSDLVENRPPRRLETKLEGDETLAESFDFSRADYRVVIALREDYLAALESLKRQMPSLAQNRLRLAPMTGRQGLQAVLGPGGALVSEEVAEAIVRFVAGGSELANAEVEPSLLSLICRELNEQRLAQQRPEISQDLLAGSHDTILSTFYERALADQPPPVRRIIEDDLLTESGYRENLAEESLLRRFDAAGVGATALATLVNRRLLRIEERLDVRRVELTHDVLTGVVKTSRDRRHEREAREATERTLAQQRSREQAARLALRRARVIALACTLLATVALAAAILAWISLRRAHRAEELARQTRALSEQARGQAEGLLGFLTEDFVDELESFGRYQTIDELSQREIDYFNALPAALKDPATIRNAASAYVNQGRARLYLGNIPAANRSTQQAIALLEPLQRGADASEANSLILARAYMWRGAILGGQADPAEIPELSRAVDLLRPIAQQPHVPLQVSHSYVDSLANLAMGEWANGHEQEAVLSAQQALRLARQLGAGQHRDLAADANYAEAGAWLANALVALGRDVEARRAALDAQRVTDEVLAQRPQFGRVLFAKQMIDYVLVWADEDQLDPVEAQRYALDEQKIALTLTGLEPGNTSYIGLLADAYGTVGDSFWLAGQLPEAVSNYRRALQTLGSIGVSESFYAMNIAADAADGASMQLQLGDRAGAAQTMANARALIARIPQAGTPVPLVAGILGAIPPALLAYERGDYGEARRIARAAREQWQSHPKEARALLTWSSASICRLALIEVRAEYHLQDFAGAEQSGRAGVSQCPLGGGTGQPANRAASEASVWLSMALARQGKLGEAARAIDPIVRSGRELEKRNRSNRWLPLEMASALYAQSLTDGPHRVALLAEASERISRTVPAIASLRDSREWRELIDAARRGSDVGARHPPRPWRARP